MPATTDPETGRFVATHGMTNSTEFRIWDGILSRCYNPNSREFRLYGARGIEICDRWRSSFANFYADMGPRPPGKSIDRIDNNRGYEPGNCKWSTRSEQQRNKRTNLLITFLGHTKTAAEWIETSGLSKNVFHLRYRRGWPMEKILSTPTGKYKKAI